MALSFLQSVFPRVSLSKGCLPKLAAEEHSIFKPDYFNKWYHPLEEVTISRDDEPARLSPAQIARTTLEANKYALLVFPGAVHRQPHHDVSWGEYRYLIDDYGDPAAEDNLVNVLIGMDMRTVSEFDDDNQVQETGNIPENWGLSSSTSSVHPLFFSECLTRAVYVDHVKRMNHPSNVVSIRGNLRRALAFEEDFLWIHVEDGDDRDTSFTFYRYDIKEEEFLYAEPDIFVKTSAILERFNPKWNDAFKALCKRKGLDAEEAYLIGVDSLGIDVRILTSAEVKTHRFPFKVQATLSI
ncbi:uncharacterized protein At3g49140-like [Abrus precatorius]|uniref:Uncharacterized protein At3g49140-like n=1 Tax=Abrus precatorius TaxID=3816 RepID=A0A8B8K230_ABRPR|nr:uncharacterized protein At3g49140-like [Abrus precatorius]